MHIKYRTWGKGIPPKHIKLQIPGWAGEPEPRKKGSIPQPWHCTPFVEGSTYGLELCYPFDAETHVINDNGKIIFKGDFSPEECVWSDPPTPPFSSFAPHHYGHTSCLDIEVPEGFALRIEPHPRFFTDITGTCPIAISGHLHSWWSKIFFVAFKAPLFNQTHIFRKNEPYAQILVVPIKSNYEIIEMTTEEKNKRSFFENKINRFKNLISKNIWKDHVGHEFNDKYKQILSVYNKEGMEGIEKLFNDLENKKSSKFSKFLGKFFGKN